MELDIIRHSEKVNIMETCLICKREIDSKPLFIVRSSDQINHSKFDLGFNAYHRKCYEDKILPKIEPYVKDIKAIGFQVHPKPDYQMINAAIVCLPIATVLLLGGVLTITGPVGVIFIAGIVATLLGFGLIAYMIAIIIAAIKSI